MMRLLISAIVLSLATWGSARADGLIQQLPEDTSWVSFKTEGFKDKSKKGGPLHRFTGHLKVSSVGIITIDSETCRWIEIEQTFRRENEPASEERGRVFKVLIAEKHLVRGSAPLEHVHRGWVAGLGKFEGSPRELRSTDGQPIPKSAFEAETQFFLAGPAADANALEPELIESKLGKVSCPGVTGSIDTSSLPNPDQGQVTSPTFELRLHKSAPFGVVSYTIKLVEPDGDRAEMKAILTDFGKTATSRLPNCQ